MTECKYRVMSHRRGLIGLAFISAALVSEVAVIKYYDLKPNIDFFDIMELIKFASPSNETVTNNSRNQYPADCKPFQND